MRDQGREQKHLRKRNQKDSEQKKGLDLSDILNLIAVGKLLFLNRHLITIPL